MPLLSHLQVLHPSLQSVLVSRIIAHLLTDPEAAAASIGMETISLTTDERKHDASYDMCIASWAYWLITAFSPSAVGSEDEAAKVEEAAVGLVAGLGPGGGNADAKAYVPHIFSNLFGALTEAHQRTLSPRCTLQEIPSASGGDLRVALRSRTRRRISELHHRGASLT